MFFNLSNMLRGASLLSVRRDSQQWVDNHNWEGMFTLHSSAGKNKAMQWNVPTKAQSLIETLSGKNASAAPITIRGRLFFAPPLL
jgi:hypothetical protein